MATSNKGFTLVELMVVISIIAILAVVGMTLYNGLQGGARDAKRKADVEAMAKAYETNMSAGSYQTLLDSWFASETQPQPPEGGSYFYKTNADQTGYRVCTVLQAAIDGGLTNCNDPITPNCYCIDSQQGVYIPGPTATPTPTPVGSPTNTPTPTPTATPIPTSTPTPTPVAGGQIFLDGFESNDFTAWTGYASSVATMTTGPTYALTGSYGAQFSFSSPLLNSGYARVYKSFTWPATNIIYLKSQIQVTYSGSADVEAPGSKAAYLITDSAANRMVWLIIGQGAGGGLSLRGVYRSQAGVDTFFGSEVELTDGVTYTVKLMLDKSGSAPVMQWWLNGISQALATDSSVGVDGVGRTAYYGRFGINHVVNWEKADYIFNIDQAGIYSADPGG